MDASRIEAELYGLVDKFNDRSITSRTFCETFLDKIHPFADGNSRTCKILFDDKIENFYKIYKKVTRFIFYSDSFPDRCRILYQEMLFFQNYAVFFINIKEEYVFMFYTLFIDQVSHINNANVLTDGRWRCYN